MSDQASCPVCGEPRAFPADIVVGERVVCLGCGMFLEVSTIRPLRVDESPRQGECWGE